MIFFLAFIIITQKHKTMQEDEKGKAMHWHVAFCISWIITVVDINVFKQSYTIIVL